MKALALVALLSGCGATEDTTSARVTSNETGGTPTTSKMEVVAGAPTLATGGTASPSDSPTGGNRASTGGSASTGGAPATGGTPSTGGALPTGGRPSTGGAMGTGGRDCGQVCPCPGGTHILPGNGCFSCDAAGNCTPAGIPCDGSCQEYTNSCLGAVPKLSFTFGCGVGS